MTDTSLAGVYNCSAVDGALATSGQPTIDQFGGISKAGFTTIINLALHDDPRYSLPDEAGTVHSGGANPLTKRGAERIFLPGGPGGLRRSNYNKNCQSSGSHTERLT